MKNQATQSPFDLVLVNSICSSTKKTFEVQAQTPVTIEKPKLMKLEDKQPDYEVSIAGIINLNTDNFCGSITIAFSSQVFLKIYERMFGETHTAISAELEDAAGEFMNIIYGTTKSELNQKPGYNLKPILPTVLSGGNLKIRQKTNLPIIVLPFTTEFGVFHLEIAIEKVMEKAA